MCARRVRPASSIAPATSRTCAPRSTRKHEERFVGLDRYLRHVGLSPALAATAPRLALIHGLGPVVAGEPPAAGEFHQRRSGAAANPCAPPGTKDVRAIVFRVNSPGGSAVGSDLVWRAVREARKRGKPVVVSMGDVAGSGGYYVAMGADAIVAEPATITGSIGVVYTKFSLGKALAAIGHRDRSGQDRRDRRRALDGAGAERSGTCATQLGGRRTLCQFHGQGRGGAQARSLHRLRRSRAGGYGAASRRRRAA